MKIRSDSPFAKLTEEQKDLLLEEAEGSTLLEVANWVHNQFDIDTTTSSVQRYLTKLRRERTVLAAQEAEESHAELAELGRNSKAREAALELTRQKLCDAVVAANSPEQLADVMKTLGEEKTREHEEMMREREMALAEENAKMARRRLDLQEARSALRLLPAIRALLIDGEMAAEDRVARAREVLMSGGGKLLALGTET